MSYTLKIINNSEENITEITIHEVLSVSHTSYYGKEREKQYELLYGPTDIEVLRERNPDLSDERIKEIAQPYGCLNYYSVLEKADCTTYLYEDMSAYVVNAEGKTVLSI